MLINPIDNKIPKVDTPLRRTKSSGQFEDAISDALEIDIVQIVGADNDPDQDKEKKNPPKKNPEATPETHGSLDIKV